MSAGRSSAYVRREHRMAKARVEIAALRVLFAAWHETLLALRANFDPNQPRVPRGSGRTSGRWRRVDGDGPHGSGREPLIIDIPARRTPADEAPSRSPKTRRLRLPSVGTATHGRPPHEPLPTIPRSGPESGRDRIRIVRRVAGFAARALLRGAGGPLGLLITVAEGVAWLHEYYPWIEAYFDPPTSLEELRRNALRGPAAGYDIHHIVERTPAENDGFPRSLFDGPNNRVRIPRLKHWEVNSWFETPNEEFEGLTPRQYVRGRSWDERFEVGLDALRNTGVLER